MIYKSGTVSVDNNFARFGSKSYSINKINTVDVNVTRPHGWGPVIGFGMVGAVMLLAAKGTAEQGSASPFVVIGLICFGVAYWAWTRTKIRDHHLILMTSSSSAQAYTTRNGDEIDALREAIESAMTREQSVHHIHEFAPPPSYTPEPEAIEVTAAKPATFRQRAIGRS